MPSKILIFVSLLWQQSFAITSNSILFDSKTDAKTELAHCQVSVGESQIINFSEDKSLTGLIQKYQLTNIDGKNFLAKIRVQFFSEELGPNSRMKLFDYQKYYSEKVQSCLDDLQPKLKGPRGESLTIQLSEDPQVPQSQIAITYRKQPTPESFPDNISCPTILHEVLHLLGLVDEYPEKGVNTCRIPSMMPSIMKYEKEDSLQLTQSLLRPAHFRFITNPLCPEMNWYYLSCATRAYQNDCAAPWKHCLKDDLWLR